MVEEYRAPLELKTGKVFRKQGTIEHRAQVGVCGWECVREREGGCVRCVFTRICNKSKHRRVYNIDSDFESR